MKQCGKNWRQMKRRSWYPVLILTGPFYQASGPSLDTHVALRPLGQDSLLTSFLRLTFKVFVFRLGSRIELRAARTSCNLRRLGAWP